MNIIIEIKNRIWWLWDCILEVRLMSYFEWRYQFVEMKNFIEDTKEKDLKMIKYLKIISKIKKRLKWLLYMIRNKKLVSYNRYISFQPRLEDILGKVLKMKKI